VAGIVGAVVGPNGPADPPGKFTPNTLNGVPATPGVIRLVIGVPPVGAMGVIGLAVAGVPPVAAIGVLGFKVPPVGAMGVIGLDLGVPPVGAMGVIGLDVAVPPVLLVPSAPLPETYIAALPKGKTTFPAEENVNTPFPLALHVFSKSNLFGIFILNEVRLSYLLYFYVIIFYDEAHLCNNVF